MSDLHVLRFLKGGEWYIVVYDEATQGDAIQILARFALDSDLSLTGYDAAGLSDAIRAVSEATATERRF